MITALRAVPALAPLRFVGVGLVNTALSLGVIAALLAAGANGYAANLAGYLAGFACSFLLNRRFTFAQAGRPEGAEVARFALAAGLAYGVNLAVLAAGQRLIGAGSLLAQLPAMAAYTATFYVLSARFVFVAEPARLSAATLAARTVLPLLVLAAALPVAFPGLPPMVDMPGHMGRYALQTGLEAHPWLAEYFSIHWQLIGNLGADILMQALVPLTGGVEPATRVVVILTQAIAASGVLLVSRAAHGRITPFALAALPLIYGFPFHFGFLNFSLAMGLALCAFAGWLRLEGRGAAQAALLTVAGLGIWVCHTFGWVFLGILCSAEALAREHAAGRRLLSVLLATARRCAPLLLPLLPMLLWRGEDAGGATTGWLQFMPKITWLFSMFRLEDPLADRLSALVVVTLLFLGAITWRLPRHAGLRLAAWLCAAGFLLLPLRVFGSAFADMRLAPYMVMVGLLSLDDRALPLRGRRVLLVVAGAFMVIRLALTGVTYAAYDRRLEAELDALDHLPVGARVLASVNLSCSTAWPVRWMSHVASMAIVRRHAFVNDQWATAGMNLVDVHYPAAGRYQTDESQIAFDKSCGETRRPDVARTMADFPRSAFTHVWIIAAPSAASLPHEPGLTPLWQRGGSALYRIEHSVSPTH